MMRVKVSYAQKFNGKILTGSYFEVINSQSDKIRIEQGLYSDPHVFDVVIEEVKE